MAIALLTPDRTFALNRYSVLFAVMVTASFALQSGTSRESAPEQGSSALAANQHKVSHRADRGSSLAQGGARSDLSGNSLPQKLIDPEDATREDGFKFLREFLKKKFAP